MPPPEVNHDLVNEIAANTIAAIQEQEDREVIFAIETGGPITINLPRDPLPGRTIRIRDTGQEVGRVVTIANPPLSREDFLRIGREPIVAQQHRMFLTQDEWADIVQWPENFRAEYAADFVSEPEAVTLQAQVALETDYPRGVFPANIDWDPPGGVVRLEANPGYFEPSYVREPADRQARVLVPEFELFSNPTIRMNDIRERRFDLIDRSPGHRDPVVALLLDALIRKKIFSLPESTHVPGAPKSVWEALLELDLVDDVPPCSS